MREEMDRLVQVLLQEELGGEKVPDFSGRILSAAFPARRRLWIRAAAAAVFAAASIALAWGILRPGYPAPEIEGAFAVAGGGEARRGATLEAKGPARLVLGGYCRIDAETGSVVRIEGMERAETIFLERGGVTCEVDRDGGAFAVRTQVGTASVAGTRFTVRLLEKRGGTEMGAIGRRAAVVMFVAVMSGGVSVEYDGRNYTLAAGGQQAFGAEETADWMDSARGFSGQTRGLVEEKNGDGTIEFKVGRVLRVWKGNSAKNAQALVGRTVTVGPSMRKGDDGTMKPAPLQKAYIEKLKAGQEITLEIVNREGDAFQILELNAEQRKVAAGEKGGDAEAPNRQGEKKAGNDSSFLPEGIRGFRGMLIGTVVSRGRDGMVVKVEKIARVWQQNKASDPESVVGREVRVANWRKSRLAAKHAEIMQSLKPGDRIEVEAFHFEGNVLSIVEELKKVE